MTRAVLFDVDGVLVQGYHARPDQRGSWDKSLRDFGMDPDRFQSEFIFDTFIKKVLIGQKSMIEALDRRLPGLGYKGSSMVFLKHWLTHDANLDQPLLALVRQLRNHSDVRLYLATNQDHTRAQWLWDTMGLSEIFEDIFYSARAGVRKPERGFFDFVEQRLGPQAEPPLFFDDTERIIEGARAYGWEAVLYENLEDCAKHPWIAARL
jgi:putative hydrolase of the HAD superfamily